MNKNNGFTLTELVVVLVLISIIMLIAYPNFSNLTDKTKAKYDNSTKLIIKNAAKLYVNNNTEEVNEYLNNNNVMCIPIGKLIAYEYLDSDFKDSSGNEIDKKICVNVSKKISGENYTYEYDTSLQTQISDDIDYLPPIIYVIKNPNSPDTNIECTNVMNMSYDDFSLYCQVKAVDNVDNSVRVDVVKSESEDQKKILLEYSAADLAGNKALPLKIQLILN